MKKRYYSKKEADKCKDHIAILNDMGEINLRPVKVEGMKRHTKEQLGQVTSKLVWDIFELRQIEVW